MAIIEGTNGTCYWGIDSDGKLSIRPTNGNDGYLLRPWIALWSDFPWYEHREKITSIELSGNIHHRQEILMSTDTEENGNFSHMFKDCSNVTTIIGLKSLKNASDLWGMFDGCSSLLSLDMSEMSLINVTRYAVMFDLCDMLSVVKLNDQMQIPNGQSCRFGSGVNESNGIIVQNDEQFSALTADDRAGTWRRGVVPAFKVDAHRSTNGSIDEDGEDVLFNITWSTDSMESDRLLSIYMKTSSESSYPSTPTTQQTLSGNSGTTQATISNIGDGSYDFKVTFYDGVNTFISFPTVASNIRLITLDTDGNVEVKGRATTADMTAAEITAFINELRGVAS